MYQRPAADGDAKDLTLALGASDGVPGPSCSPVELGPSFSGGDRLAVRTTSRGSPASTGSLRGSGLGWRCWPAAPTPGNHAETRYRHCMRFTVELDRETDGRWIAEVRELPGVLAYGPTRADALAAVKALALRALADKIEHGEIGGDLADFSFLAA